MFASRPSCVPCFVTSSQIDVPEHVLEYDGGDTASIPGKLFNPIKLELPLDLDIDEATRTSLPNTFRVSTVKLRKHRTKVPNRPKFEAILDLDYGDQPEPAASKGISADQAMAVSHVLNFLPNVVVNESTDLPTSLTVYSTSTRNTLTDLIENLSPLALPETHGETLLVILVTANYAAELTANGTVIPSMLSRLVPEPSEFGSSRGIQTLVAVVDKLPTRASSPLTRPERSVRLRSSKVASDDPGTEGISVSISTSTHYFATETTRDNWSTDSNRFTHSLEPDKPATLTFNINPSHSEVLQGLTGDATDMSDVRAYSVQMPLSATIFQNGMKSTLILGRYVRQDGAKDFSLQRQQAVQHAQVTLAASPGVGTTNTTSINLPLLRLTNSKSVTSCMGNIVREMGPPGDVFEKASQPASLQLETAVAEYFKSTGVAPHAMSVWALVIPKDFSKSTNDKQSRLSSALTPSPSLFDILPDAASHWKYPGSPFLGLDNVRIDELFARGVRLVRVTSGGGGWGNKAGLLSFDPDTSYETTAVPFAEALLGPDFVEDSEPTSGLKEIAKKGDLVQFHCLPDQIINPETQLPRREIHESRPGEISVDFGVVPSTVDELVTEEQEENVTQGHNVAVIRNHFGALSEKGMSLKIRTFDTEQAVVTPVDRDTKIDVPFSRFSIRHLPWFTGASYRKSDDVDDKKDPQADSEDAMFAAVEKATNKTLRKHDIEVEQEDMATKKTRGQLQLKPTMPRRSTYHGWENRASLHTSIPHRNAIKQDASDRTQDSEINVPKYTGSIEADREKQAEPQPEPLNRHSNTSGRKENVALEHEKRPEPIAYSVSATIRPKPLVIKKHAYDLRDDSVSPHAAILSKRAARQVHLEKTLDLQRKIRKDDGNLPRAPFTIRKDRGSNHLARPALADTPPSPPTAPLTSRSTAREKHVLSLATRLDNRSLSGSPETIDKVKSLLATLPPSKARTTLSTAFYRAVMRWYQEHKVQLREQGICDGKDAFRTYEIDPNAFRTWEIHAPSAKPSSKAHALGRNRARRAATGEELLDAVAREEAGKKKRGTRKPTGRTRRLVTDLPESEERGQAGRINSRVRLARRERGRKELLDLTPSDFTSAASSVSSQQDTRAAVGGAHQDVAEREQRKAEQVRKLREAMRSLAAVWGENDRVR
ncbi:Hypothetical protein D9617_9g024480 [Elsinoe fawcettii]|nr:Hypothetical protein D9617_9g024480 [Elsinoe fawcettii]